MEEQDSTPTALPIPLQLKFWNWGQRGPSKYFYGTQILVTHLPYHGPYKANVHSHLPDSWVPSDDFIIPEIDGSKASRTLEVDYRTSQPTSVPRRISFYDSHSTAPKNGETPSPTTLHVAGAYFHFPSPDTDVPSHSYESTLPYYSTTLPSIEASRSLAFSVSTSTATYSRIISPSFKEPRSSPRLINVQDIRYSPSSSSRRLRHNAHENGRSSRNGRNGHFHYRRATVHGGRGKPYLERERKYYQTGLPSTFTERHPQIQATLKTVGIDDETILRRDKKIRVLCCREDARYCFLAFRLMYMLSCFEEV